MTAAQSTAANPADDQGLRPTPDPTVLTTDALRREVAALKELITSDFKALTLVTEERFRSVTQRFDLAEQARTEQKLDTKAAVDAALIAQKEAVKEQTTASGLSIAKSEAATAEQLKQLGVNFTTAISGVTAVLNDLKDRVVKIESARLGGRESRQEARESSAALYALGGFVISLVLTALAVAGFAIAQ